MKLCTWATLASIVVLAYIIYLIYEIRARIYEKKRCRHICLWCEYKDMCEYKLCDRKHTFKDIDKYDKQ